MVKIFNINSGGLRREGITSSQLEMFKRMDMSDIRIDMAAVHNNEADVIDEFNSMGCRVIIFPDRQADTIKYACRLLQVMRKEKYDIVHVHGSSSIMVLELMLARLAGVKVRIAHSRNTMCDHTKTDKFLRPVFNHSYTHALACGQEAGEWMFGKHPFIVAHDGRDLSKFRYSAEIRQQIREKYHLSNRLAIGYVGNINHVKNLPFLLKVFEGVLEVRPDAILFIIGDGPDREKLKRLHIEAGLKGKVIFTGRIPNVNEVIQGMDVMALPSIHEGLPLVVLEWQIAGIPSIISDSITRECHVTDLITYLPINQGIDEWVRQLTRYKSIGNRKDDSEQACRLIKKSGFEIDENAKFMLDFYGGCIK